MYTEERNSLVLSITLIISLLLQSYLHYVSNYLYFAFNFEDCEFYINIVSPEGDHIVC